jgi:hypothetical protein
VTTVTCTWNVASNGGTPLTGHRVRRRTYTDGVPGPWAVVVDVGLGTATSGQDSTAVAGTTYGYAHAARNAVGEAAYSAEQLIRPTAAGPNVLGLTGAYVWGTNGGTGSGAWTDPSTGFTTQYNGTLNLPVYESWLGKRIDLIHDFTPVDRWDALDPGYILNGWQSSGKRLFLTMKMLQGPYDWSGPSTGPLAGEKVSLGEGASGKYDALWTSAFQTMVSRGFGNAYIRLGAEMNGGWERHRAKAYTVVRPRTTETVGQTVSLPYVHEHGEWRGGPLGVVQSIGSGTTISGSSVGTGQNQVEYVGAWTMSGTGYTDVAGAYVNVRFTGTSISQFGTKKSDLGILAWSIDGGPETLVDAYSPTTVSNTQWFSVTGLSNTTHTLRVRVTGTKNPSSSGAFIDAERWSVPGAVNMTVLYDQPKLFADYFRRVVQLGRAVPGQQFRFVWCPTRSYQQFDAAECYPGDDRVDVIGLDTYDEVYQNAPVTDPVVRWRSTLNGQHELQHWLDFAKAGANRRNGDGSYSVKATAKPFGLPEWGTNYKIDGGVQVGGEDNPYYIERMAEVIANPVNNVEFHLYFDVSAGDGDHCLYRGENRAQTRFPRAAAKYRELFGG